MLRSVRDRAAPCRADRASLRPCPSPAAAARRLACALGAALAGAALLGAAPLAAQPIAPGGAVAALSGTTTVSRDVTVRDGDTFAAIARRELGNGGFAADLAAFNGVAPGEAPPAGQIVRVPILVPARGEAGRVVFVKGEVTIDGLPLERDALVIPGNVIVTTADGFASIEFSSGSVVNLQPDTTATIARLSCLEADDSCLIEIETSIGEVQSDVNARDRQPIEYRISTPYASAAVRGTEFDTVVDPEALRVAVTEGDIVVEALGETQALDTGFGSVTREGEAPGEPIALLPAPVFRSVPTRAAAGDALAWFALSGAVRYVVTFALDSDGNRIVAEREVDGERLEIPAGVDSGDYYLGLRGIDVNELPGFRSTALLGVVDVDPAIAPVEVRVTREGREFLVEVIEPPEGASGFEIQVATTPDFADPLGVEVAETGRAVLRLDADTLYARARTLLDLRTVSAFGPVASGS